MIDITTVSWAGLGWIIAAFALAMWLIASGLCGFDRARLTPVERVARVGIGLVALAPQMLVAGAAAIIGLALIGREWIMSKPTVTAAG